MKTASVMLFITHDGDPKVQSIKLSSVCTETLVYRKISHSSSSSFFHSFCSKTFIQISMGGHFQLKNESLMDFTCIGQQLIDFPCESCILIPVSTFTLCFILKCLSYKCSPVYVPGWCVRGINVFFTGI